MPALVAVLVYWFRVLRRPMDVRLKRRHVGGSAVLTLGAGMIVLWVQERPMILTSLSCASRRAGQASHLSQGSSCSCTSVVTPLGTSIPSRSLAPVPGRQLRLSIRAGGAKREACPPN